MKGVLDGYKSEEDPDYETESDEDSIDGSGDEAEEDSSEDEEEEENDVSEQEAWQEKHLKDLAQVVMEEQVLQVQLMGHQQQELVVEVVWDLHTSLVLEEVDPLEEEMVD